MKAHKLALLFGCLAAIVLCSTANAVELAKGNDKVSAGKEDGNNTTPQQAAFQSVVQFNVKKSDFNQACVESTEIKLQEVTWKIKACKEKKEKKEGENEKSVLKVSLVSVFSGDTSKWSCEAKANFTLKGVNAEPAISKQLDKKPYSIDQSENPITEFTDWETFEKYLSADHATFEITLTISPPNRVPQLDLISTAFHFQVPNINSPNGTESKVVVLRGIRWHFRALKTKKGDVDVLAFHLFANPNDMEYNYQWKATANVKLLSSKQGVEPVPKLIEKSLHWRLSSWGHSQFIDWESLTDESKEYVVNNGAIFQIELSVGAPEPFSS